MSSFISSLKKLPSSCEMRQWDQNAINFGIPETMLMENASLACKNLLEELSLLKQGDFAVMFMGNGNNGGDAAALARHLHDAGIMPLVFHLREADLLKGAAAFHTNLALADNIRFIRLTDLEDGEQILSEIFRHIFHFCQQKPRFFVDGILGTGFSGLLRPQLINLIQAINNLAEFFEIPVFAIDTPSGLNCDTGFPQPVAIKASVTLTLAAAKPGLLVPQARQYTGRLFYRKIGFPKEMKFPCSWRLLDGESLLGSSHFPDNSFKNRFGHIYIIGGSREMNGAVRLSALAALRSGAGLATICSPGDALLSANAATPEIMLCPLGTDDWPEELSERLRNILEKATVLIIGPGMGRGNSAKNFLRSLLKWKNRPPTVFDADSLFILGQNQDYLKFINKMDVLTPHPGEAAFLLQCAGKDIQADRVKALKDLTSLVPGVLVLKGAGTIIGQRGKTSLLCPYDIPQMAIAGAGDVLSGCIGALLCAPEFVNDSFGACAKGVILHAMAGLHGACEYPDRGMLASDLANNLSKVSGFIKSEFHKKRMEGELPWPAFKLEA